MTYEQTIKAFEYCMNQNECSSCCPYDDDEDTNEGCTSKLVEDVLDLIKRQQAEIERLQTEKDNLIRTYKECMTEAVKEFAERLLESKYESSDWSHGEHPYVVEESDIENLLYELTEGSNEKEI